MFTIIGGNPFTGYKGSTMFTSLRVVGTTPDFEEMKQIVEDSFDECCGLFLILFDGKEIESDENFNWIDPTKE